MTPPSTIDMESLLLSMASMTLALIVVLALAYVVLRVLRGPLLRRLDGKAGQADTDALHFVRALPLGPKERVVLIDYRGQRLMLGVTAGGINVLQTWPLESTASTVANMPNPKPRPAEQGLAVTPSSW